VYVECWLVITEEHGLPRVTDVAVNHAEAVVLQGSRAAGNQRAVLVKLGVPLDAGVFERDPMEWIKGLVEIARDEIEEETAPFEEEDAPAEPPAARIGEEGCP
jgi:hypothetical protein